MAMNFGEGSAEPVVNYISWCDGNSVIGQDQRGELYVRANCGDLGLQCKASQRYVGQTQIATAVCSK